MARAFFSSIGCGFLAEQPSQVFATALLDEDDDNWRGKEFTDTTPQWPIVENSRSAHRKEELHEKIDKARTVKQGQLAEQTLILREINEREKHKLEFQMALTDIQLAANEEEKPIYVLAFNKLKDKIRGKTANQENEVN